MYILMFIKYCWQFISNTAFKEGELDVAKKTFNPVKFFSLIFLMATVVFSYYYAYKVYKVNARIEEICPTMTRTIGKDGYIYPIHRETFLQDVVAICDIRIVPKEEIEGKKTSEPEPETIG